MKNLIAAAALTLCLLTGFAMKASAQTSMPVTQDNPNITPSGTVITGTGTYVIPVGSDLLDNATATSSPAYSSDQANWQRDGAGGVPKMTDGMYGGLPQRGTTATGGYLGGFDVTYNLGSGLVGGANPLGYNLTDIDVYSGWNDSGRYAQTYTVSYELVGSSTFTDLSTVSQFPASNVSSYQGAETVLSPKSGMYIQLPGAVKAVKFDFTGSQYIGYAELVVNGSVAPEPGTYALLGLGLASLVLVARVRRSNQA